ncbi:hypothetical protein EHQ82_19240 [Leptospira selangorensis]|uniref:Uncharacterized protein n=1 Tax=Leptospira selangorensis TaxID=2484982 RepID=A0ABY2N0Q1_9LEPT|nr:hypothetical protein [Leptospira selangorensis]TGM13637.1 hypothetical protein EHQ82_19240 [Leptospira selangorensis]
MQKDHAKHNEAVCDLLLANGNFSDWVVTTSFYSALHYVQHEIFPITEQGITFPDLDSYYHHLKQNGKQKSKHRVTINLVNTHIKNAAPKYRWLYDSCMNARYTNYKISKTLATQARKYLTEIKQNLKK